MIGCPNCRAIQPDDAVNTDELSWCPVCDTEFRIDVFPALYLKPEHQAPGDSIINDGIHHGQAECFCHPGKRAVAPCSSCGRMLCSLCQVGVHGQSLCMSCLESGKEKKKISFLENRRTLYDNIALLLSLLPVLVIFPTLITAPVAIYVCLRYWRTPLSVIPRTRIRFVAAFLFSMGQIVIWFLFISERVNLL
ncbi:MAG: hypothetical protein GY874_11290 [Desulfobacteraceae bacterium]|nr:hypothetical protein [Desulfobacteraceae bacterium]